MSAQAPLATAAVHATLTAALERDRSARSALITLARLAIQLAAQRDTLANNNAQLEAELEARNQELEIERFRTGTLTAERAHVIDTVSTVAAAVALLERRLVEHPEPQPPEPSPPPASPGEGEAGAADAPGEGVSSPLVTSDEPPHPSTLSVKPRPPMLRLIGEDIANTIAGGADDRLRGNKLFEGGK